MPERLAGFRVRAIASWDGVEDLYLECARCVADQRPWPDGVAAILWDQDEPDAPNLQQLVEAADRHLAATHSGDRRDG